MALQNAQSHYLRIPEGGVDPVRAQIQTEVWKDAATRATPTDFDQPVLKTYDAAGYLDVEASADAAKSIADNLITAGYLALKQLTELAAFDTDV